ncbi:hypothetical protein [Roseitranquillus sediminis]|uniref:hypothetical protein n=1 Tax=Roseitranquillus sediminis TaxID=2809051 RepID=UPI001D0C2A65|nr:hypothetical protein [Roseitranquillus sediminis]MBM9596372.1 hypothetical protein [Roseitranquillus sediminis]
MALAMIFFGGVVGLTLASGMAALAHVGVLGFVGIWAFGSVLGTLGSAMLVVAFRPGSSTKENGAPHTSLTGRINGTWRGT